MNKKWELFFYLMGYSTAGLMLWLIMNVLTGNYSSATLGFLGDTLVIITVVTGLVVTFGDKLGVRLHDNHNNK